MMQDDTFFELMAAWKSNDIPTEMARDYSTNDPTLTD